MSEKHSLANRLIALTLSIILVLGMLPTGAIATGDAEIAYATVESLTNGVVVNETGENLKVAFTGSLNWVAKNEANGRSEDGWWIGLKVIAPDTLNLETAKYKSGSQEKLFKDYADGAAKQYIELWSLVKEDYLRSANQTDGLSTYTWSFDWDGNGAYEQTMILDIVADKTVLNKDGAKVFPAESMGTGAVTGLSQGAVVNGNTVTYAGVELEWSAADPYAGRGQDGWWVGMQITAPEQMTKAEDFTYVTYQRLDGGKWSEAKSFWNAQDSDKDAESTARYLNMWGLVNPALIAADQDGILTYQYRFDWNQDGIYEQDLAMKIDVSNIKLTKNGIQQYPVRYGAAEGLTGGTVTGSGTAQSVINVENVTLNWSPAKPALGRGQDGWWIGGKITAPAGMTTKAECENITYQRYENGAWSAAKSFWNNQDSDKDAESTARYLTMWGLITPELIANDNDGVLTYQYRFDWNQDGEYEQVLNLQLNASKVTLLDADGYQVYPALGNVTALTSGTVTGNATGNTVVTIANAELAWSEKNPAIGRNEDGWWVGMKVQAPAGTDMENVKFRRKVSADSWTDAMAFAPDNSADTMQLWGLVTAEYLDTFIGYGRNMNYVWQFDWNGDGTYEQTVTMTINPNNITLKQAGFAFDRDEDTITYGDNDNKYQIVAPTGGQSKDKPVYSIDNTDVATLNDDGTLTILKSGDVTITATLNGTHYAAITDSYVLHVEKADQPSFGFVNAPEEVTWQAEALAALTLTGRLGTGEVTWSILGDSDVAKVDAATGKITLLKAGKFTIQAQNAGDDCYNASAVVETEIVVKHADQTGFQFVQATDTVTYNDVDKNAENGTMNAYTLLTEGGQSTGDVTFEVIAGEAATVENGVLTILKSGTVTVKATKADDEQYNATTAEFTLTVKKADQSFTFGCDKDVQEKYGLLTFASGVTASELNSGKLVYAVSENDIGATVDAEGLVSFANSEAKVGSVTVTATLEEDECYNEFSDSYTITLTYADAPEAPYALSGDQVNADSGWFTGDVTITAGEGYLVSYTNVLDADTWTESVVWTEDGQAGTWENAPMVYLKNAATGAITDAISVADLKRDTQKPDGLSIAYDVTVTATILEKLFGFSASEVKVTVKAEDAMSGIGKMEYSLDQGNSYTEVAEQDGKFEFTVSAEYRGQLYLRATDVAGNAEVYAHLDADGKDQVLVIDSIAPGLNVGYNGTMNDDAEEGIRYVKGDEVTVTFIVSDENFDLRENDPVVTVNGQTAAAEWVITDTTGTLTVTLADEGDYVFEASFTDRLNRTVSYTSEVRIDRTAPVIDSDIVTGTYYTADQNFALTITEHNFDAAEVELTVEAVDSKGDSVQIADFAAMAKDADNWTTEGDVHTLILPIDVDGNYTVIVDCDDVLGWTAETHGKAFVLDKVAPDAPVLTYAVVDEVKDTWIKEILNKLFGFYPETLKVTVTTGDATSNIAYLEYKIHDEDEFTVVTMDENNQYSFDLDPQYRGIITAVVYDMAGRSSKTVDNKEIVLDATAPELDVTYEGTMNDEASPEDGPYYVREQKVTITVDVADENFDLRENDPVVTVNGDEITGWVCDLTTGKLVFTLEAEGDYDIGATFTDRLNRTVSYASHVRIDRTIPVIDSDIVADPYTYYTENQNFVLTITEHNFDAEQVKLTVAAVDSKGNTVLTEEQIAEFAAMAKNAANWTTEGDVHTLILPITVDGNYTVTVDCTDVLGWTAQTHAKVFTLDKVNPDAPVLTYEVVEANWIWEVLNKLFGFSRETIQVTVTSADATAGIAYLQYKIHDEDEFTVVDMDENGQYTFKLDPQYRGVITAEVFDEAGRSTKTVDDKEIVVDNIAPEVSFEFFGDRQDAVKADGDEITRETMSLFDETTRYIYNGAVTAQITLVEANFFEDMIVTVFCDGEQIDDLAAAGITDSGWVKVTEDGIKYTRTFVMSEDGDYVIEASYTDQSANDMVWTSNEYEKRGTAEFVSNIHTVDTTVPVYEVTYDNNEVTQTLEGREYYGAPRTATIKVTDRNFRPSEVVFTVVSEDVANTGVEFIYSDLTDWADWTQDGDTWTAVVPFEAEANYTVDFSYDDLANNKVEADYNKKFTVDTQAPTDLTVTFQSKDETLVSKILDTITFGHHEAGQQVVLSMFDATAGIDYIALTVTPEDPACATDLTMPENLLIYANGAVKSGSKGFIGEIDSKIEGGKVTLTFDVPAQFRGNFSFVAYDKSGNSSDDHNDAGTLVVDTIAPGHEISYNPINVVNVADMKDMQFADGVKDITDTKASYVMYFNTDAVATIQITEANFDPSVVKIEVLNAKGEPVTGWKQSAWTTTTEAGKTDVHTKTVTISAQGDYQIKVYYQDHSMNTPVDYLSQWIVVDKTAPVINVKYSNTDVKNTIGGRNYFSAAQTATITIKERNFRADDVVIKVIAKDVLGADVLALNPDGTVKAYATQGANRKSWSAYEAGTWRRTDDAYVITLNYTADANYTFDIEYTDLAKNKAADYAADQFTVDVTAPKNLTVSYSTSVFEQIKESITFGYYNAQMTVTITAEDDTSGIYHFAYSYIKGKNVSGVNAELLDQAIREASITYSGKKATATFNIPKMVLGNDNQFNGTVQFTAYDRSEVKTELKDSKVIVVDNITPTAKVTYNTPVQNANGISYYDGNIEVSIVITEANFDAKDTVVTVTKDGSSYPVNVTWKDNNVDTHTGSFVLNKDGDYIVSVNYKDKSGNKMATYTSNQLTLDATKPTIHVSNIQANSANKDEEYGFVITINDTNLNASSMTPVLKAVVQNDKGIYEEIEIDLGAPTTIVSGKTYTYTVENLTEDALYTLTCVAKDMSNNTMAQVVLPDGESYGEVLFSINRNGSTFAYGNDFTKELVEQYFVYEVAQDLVVVEVNVDPIENYAVSLNGKKLTEGVDYTTTQTSKDGEWSKRTYVIKKSLFAEEGEYNIVVTSTDKTETTAFSDVKNLTMAFVVDQTIPVMTITGLEASGRYQTEVQTVTLIPSDEGGRLNSLVVLLLDSDGNPMKNDANEDISVRFDMEGEELLQYLEDNDGMISFEIPECLNGKVKIICNDCAINAENLTNEYNELFEKVTVSPSKFIIFYANTELFIGTIVGVLAVIGLIIYLIKRKKNGKNNTEAKA